MMDNCIATFDLTAKGKGKEAPGNPLKILNNARLYLLRYVPYCREKSCYSIAPLKEVQEYATVEGLPNLSTYGYSYIRHPLREGYIYIFIEKKQGKSFYAEYEVSAEGDLTRLKWKDNNNSRISWQNPESESASFYISLKREFDKKLWIAFSPIRWDEKYATTTLANADKRNARMQMIECEKCFDGTFGAHSFSVKEANNTWSYSRFLGDETKASFDHQQAAYSSRQEEKRKQACAQVEKKGNNPCDFYVTILDPLGVADFICRDWNFRVREHLVLIESLKTGSETKARERVNHDRLNEPYENLELAALVDLGILVYRGWSSKIGLFYEYSSYLDEHLLKQVLQVDPRAAIRREINAIRKVMIAVMSDDAYQLVFNDCLEGDCRVQLEGKLYFCNHLNAATIDPKVNDSYMDKLPEVADKGAPDISKFINKVTAEISITGKLLHKEWPMDIIATMSNLSVLAGITFDSVVESFGLWIKYVSKQQQETFITKVFRFTTQNGARVVKFPESQIPDRLRKKMNLSNLRNKTIKGSGAAYIVDFSRATDSNGKPLSAKAKTWNQLSGVSITVDTPLSRWKENILKLSDAKWKKNAELFVNSKHFARGMTGINIISLGMAIQKEEKNFKDGVDIAAYSLEILYLNMRYAEQSVLLPKEILRVSSSTVVKFVGAAASLAFAASAAFDAISLLETNETGAASLALLSGLFGLGGSVALALSVGGPIVIGLFIISFTSAIVLEIIRKNELQLLLGNCAYSKEHRLKAGSGTHLLVVASSKQTGVKDALKKYLSSQQFVLNQLAFVAQGLFRAKLTFCYDYKCRSPYDDVMIFESTYLDCIKISFDLLNMPLTQGELEISIWDIKVGEGTAYNIDMYLEARNEYNININAETGSVVVQLHLKNKERYRTLLTGGMFKVMVRTLQRAGEKEIYTPYNINSVQQCVAFYFTYQLSMTLTQRELRSGGTKKYLLENPSIDDEHLLQECDLVKTEVEPKWKKNETAKDDQQTA